MNNQNINVVALVKGEERWIFLFSDDKYGETLRMLGRYAANPKLSFSRYDAAVLSGKIRNIKEAEALPSAPYVVPESNRNTRYRKHLPEPKPEDKVDIRPGFTIESQSLDKNAAGFYYPTGPL